MIRYLTLEEVLELHRMVLEQSGGMGGVRDLGAAESSLAQPRMTFGGQELYPSLAEKAAALALSLVCNHPFVDGNKRVGHAAMETFLVLNGWEVAAGVDEQERLFLRLAGGGLKREEFTAWLQAHLQERPSEQ
jgi:death-on-curing protein